MSIENLNANQRELALKMIEQAQSEIGTDFDQGLISQLLDSVQQSADQNGKAIRRKVLKIIES